MLGAETHPRDTAGSGIDKHGAEFRTVYRPFSEMMSDKDLPLGARHLGAYLVSVMGFGGIVKMAQKEIAEELGTDPASVSKWVTALEQGWYVRRKKIGRNVLIKINPCVAWMGTIPDGKKKRSAWLRLETVIRSTEHRKMIRNIAERQRAEEQAPQAA